MSKYKADMLTVINGKNNLLTDPPKRKEKIFQLIIQPENFSRLIKSAHDIFLPYFLI